MRRLTLSLLIVVVSAVIGLGWGIDQWYSQQQPALEDSALNAYKNVGRDLAILIDQQGVQVEWDDWFAFSNLHPQVIPYAEFPLPENLKASFEKGEALLLESGDQLSLNYYLASQDQVLSLMLPDELRQESGSWINWLLTFLFYAGVILMVLVWLYPLLRRLALLRRTAQEFGAGNLQARIAIDKNSYINSIEVEFNRMAQRIEQLIADNKLLSRGLSHDLRTPLARLRFGLDVLGEADLPPLQQRQLAHLNRDMVAMEGLVEALLNYARLEQAQISFRPAPTVIADFVQTLHGEFYREQVELLVAPAAIRGCCRVDTEYIAMLLHNLLQNALRYGGGKVRLSLDLHAQEMLLVVEDNGSGVAPEERDKVLKPFYRSSHLEATDTRRGHGLGLAIVERIAQWHEAGLDLGESETLGGLKVVLSFQLCR
ncbi:ATP-binding protein [Cellvibrio sp. KY-GH-1]|uniref:ATP-binding protein n=1 Tax=Cellvibrio sp. KY-GH-1 TaxID=2303332 RepID=UPI0012472202|nr:ATP-binding protein [Cellvibrio sp. KY-GH-1]